MVVVEAHLQILGRIFREARCSGPATPKLDRPAALGEVGHGARDHNHDDREG
jgi:hypothetical protein